MSGLAHLSLKEKHISGKYNVVEVAVRGSA